jgi:hypothetical protein
MQSFSRRFPLLFVMSLAFAVGMLAASTAALAQAYTYDTPTCGGTWRDEPSKPQELRVVWEMSAAQACVQQSNFPLACRHLQAGIAASDRMGADAGSPDGLKSYMKTMMRTHGCQQ